MNKQLLVVLLIVATVSATACSRRMAPFSPHRTNTDAHHLAANNQACLECHAVAEIGHGHQVSDNCLRCHRIVQGD